MTTSWKTCLGSVLVLGAGLRAFPQAPFRPETTLQITVRIFDLVGVPSRTLAQAQQQASRILQQAGLQTAWLHCPLSLTEARTNTSCNEPWGPIDLDLRISTRTVARRSGVPDGALGSAFPFAERNHASMFYEHVEELAQGGRASRAEILGHVMTHEIGHLLFRSMKHSPVGIMRAQWNDEDLGNAARGRLCFTPEEATNLRNEVLRRVIGNPNQ
jgi:hypothetical protein